MDVMASGTWDIESIIKRSAIRSKVNCIVSERQTKSGVQIINRSAKQFYQNQITDGKQTVSDTRREISNENETQNKTYFSRKTQKAITLKNG